jgi:deazaflavin-dependent oxidoreductase (nitroreductase family)
MSSPDTTGWNDSVRDASLSHLPDHVRRAIEITPAAGTSERIIDITTLGRRTGRPRRIEIWFYRVGETNYLSGLPGKRSWYANLQAHPAFTFHLKNGIRADLPATARTVTDPTERHRILSEIVDDLNQPHNPARITQPTRLEDWENGSPLVEIIFDCQITPDGA